MPYAGLRHAPSCQGLGPPRAVISCFLQAPTQTVKPLTVQKGGLFDFQSAQVFQYHLAGEKLALFTVPSGESNQMRREVILFLLGSEPPVTIYYEKSG